MQARKLAETSAAPIQLSLRVRHPAIDPAEISTSLGLEPEHSFKAGDSRSAGGQGRVAGRHTQTYWLAPVSPDSWGDPVEPSFLAAIVAKTPNRDSALSAEDMQAAARTLHSRSVEGLLLHFLLRLHTCQDFLQRLQREGGDVSLIVAVERESAPDFTLPLAVARLLVRLSVAIEFSFDS
jgi:hypothetical protein